MSAETATSPRDRFGAMKPFEVIIEDVFAGLRQRGGSAELPELHAHFRGRFTADQLRAALDALRRTRRITSERDRTSRVTYSEATGTPLPRAVEMAAKGAPPAAPDTIRVMTTCTGPVPTQHHEGSAAPVPPSDEGASTTSRETARAAVLRLLTATPDGATTARLVELSGHPRGRLSVALSQLKRDGAVIAEGYPCKFRLAPPEAAQARPARRILQLDLKVDALERLQPLVAPDIAELLGDIRQDLLGAIA